MHQHLKDLADKLGVTYTYVDNGIKTWEGLPIVTHHFYNYTVDQYGVLYSSSLMFVETDGYFTIHGGTHYLFSIKTDAESKLRKWAEMLGIIEEE